MFIEKMILSTFKNVAVILYISKKYKNQYINIKVGNSIRC